MQKKYSGEYKLNITVKPAEFNKIAEDIFIEVLNEMLFEEVAPMGSTKKTLRKVDGQLKIVRKRK